jgi:hypothetical protein
LKSREAIDRLPNCDWGFVPTLPFVRSTLRLLNFSTFLTSSFFFIDILALFAKKLRSTITFQLPATPFPDDADPGVWGLRCPEGTGQAERHNLTARSVRAGARPDFSL